MLLSTNYIKFANRTIWICDLLKVIPDKIMTVIKKINLTKFKPTTWAGQIKSLQLISVLLNEVLIVDYNHENYKKNYSYWIYRLKFKKCNSPHDFFIDCTSVIESTIFSLRGKLQKWFWILTVNTWWRVSLLVKEESWSELVK